MKSDAVFKFTLPIVALLILITDQLTKMVIRAYPEGYVIFEAGIFRIIRIHNTGAAFGLFQGQSFILTIIAIFGITGMLIYAFVAHRRFPLADSIYGKLALGLALGGAVGNLADRIRFGYVTDFLDFTYWPAFNVADSAIVVGVIILAFSLYYQMLRTEA